MQYDINKAIEASIAEDTLEPQRWEEITQETLDRLDNLVADYNKVGGEYERIVQKIEVLNDMVRSGEIFTKEFLTDYFREVASKGKYHTEYNNLGYNKKQEDELNRDLKKAMETRDMLRLNRKSELTKFLEMVRDSGNQTVSDYAMEKNGFADARIGRMITRHLG